MSEEFDDNREFQIKTNNQKIERNISFDKNQLILTGSEEKSPWDPKYVPLITDHMSVYLNDDNSPYYIGSIYTHLNSASKPGLEFDIDNRFMIGGVHTRLILNGFGLTGAMYNIGKELTIERYGEEPQYIFGTLAKENEAIFQEVYLQLRSNDSSLSPEELSLKALMYSPTRRALMKEFPIVEIDQLNLGDVVTKDGKTHFSVPTTPSFYSYKDINE